MLRTIHLKSTVSFILCSKKINLIEIVLRCNVLRRRLDYRIVK